MEDQPCRAKPEVKSTFCYSRVRAAAAEEHLERDWVGSEIRVLSLKPITRSNLLSEGGKMLT